MSSDDLRIKINKNDLLVDTYSHNPRRYRRSNKVKEQEYSEPINLGKWLLVIFLFLMVLFFTIG